jgi:hypothetical protein
MSDPLGGETTTESAHQDPARELLSLISEIEPDS